jgi:hypothetical protein
VSFRTKAGVAERKKPWMVAGSTELSNTLPWRTFRWYKGQRHYSGRYWSATMGDHVVYESRLELSPLIFDDFDQAVHRILAQPFLLKAEVAGKITGSGQILKSAEAFFRRGTSGAGRELLTEAELARYDRRAAELASADMLRWLHRP